MFESKYIDFVRQKNSGQIEYIKGHKYIIPANTKVGFSCDFSLFVPEGCESKTTLLVHCCNIDEAPHTLEQSKFFMKEAANKINTGLIISNTLKIPMLMPLIPKIEGYNAHALTKDVLSSDINNLIVNQEQLEFKDRLPFEELIKLQTKCFNLPHQLINMTKTAQKILNELSIDIDEKFIIEGYGDGARFANYFTALYSNKVRACICGQNDGIAILPIKEYNNQELNYPFGISDIPLFEPKTFKKVPQLYYILKNKETLNQECDDIKNILGISTQSRFELCEKIYNENHINAMFKNIYKITNLDNYVDSYIINFIKAIIKRQENLTDMYGHQKIHVDKTNQKS